MAKGVFAAAEYAAVTIPEYPKLASWAVPVELGDGRLQLRGSVSAFTLPHPLFASIFRRVRKYLDGSRTVDEIAQAAGGEVDASAIAFLLKMLTAYGLLVGGSQLPQGRTPEPQLRFFEQMDRDALRAIASLETKTVRVFAEENTAALVASLFHQAGLPRVDRHALTVGETSGAGERAADEFDHADLIVLISEGLSDRAPVVVNEQCLRTGVRWLSAHISGPQARLGPTFVPHNTACYTCFKHRLNFNSANVIADQAFESAASSHPEQGNLDAFTFIVAGQVVLEAVRLLTGLAEPSTIARYYSFNAMSAASESHDVLRVPRCASCGGSKILRHAWDIAPAGGEL